MIFDIFLIAIALSMDTFSLSLGLGTYNVTRKNKITLSLMVGLMHFFMPLLGTIIGSNIMAFFSLNSNLFLGCILIFIAINLIILLICNCFILLTLKINHQCLYLGCHYFHHHLKLDQELHLSLQLIQLRLPNRQSYQIWIFARMLLITDAYLK